MKETFLFVVFTTSPREYIYACGNPQIRAGNVVEAPVNHGQETHHVLVTRVLELEESELPIPRKYILTIDKIISEEDYKSEFKV